MNEHRNSRWFNRTVLGIGIASFFSDLGHETATAILPLFLASIGAAPAALGVIEGVADAISSFSKLGAGWYSDRLHSRKPLAVSGYFLTAIAKASFAIATNWIHVLIGRTIGWFGRGIRGPVRDAIMVDAVRSDATGRAFGFERTLDTLGAVVGPILAMALVSITSLRTIFLLTLIPGLLATISFAFLVRERHREIMQPQRFVASVKSLSPDFRRLLVAVGLFGMGDFAHTLLIFHAVQILSKTDASTANQLAVLLYVVHNIVYAAASYPMGWLGDRIGKRNILLIGYGLAAAMNIGFIVAGSGYVVLVGLFATGGLYIAIEDALERALAADLVSSEVRGTGFGVLATVNGIGDFVSSAVVGFLWSSFSVEVGFGFAAVCSLIGMFALFRLRSHVR